MNGKEKIIKIFKLIGYIFSHMMVAVVAFNYGYMFYAIKFEGSSSPASISFIFAIPFIIIIFICVVIVEIIKKKIKDE